VASPFVVTLGRVALEAVRSIEPHDLCLSTHACTAIAWNGRSLIPLYHPSRQSTLHRSQAQQDDDWRRLGDSVRAMTHA
jgi:uracil-DNA glycosylase